MFFKKPIASTKYRTLKFLWKFFTLRKVELSVDLYETELEFKMISPTLFAPVSTKIEWNVGIQDIQDIRFLSRNTLAIKCSKSGVINDFNIIGYPNEVSYLYQQLIIRLPQIKSDVRRISNKFTPSETKLMGYTALFLGICMIPISAMVLAWLLN
jgi:hypothetical protein